MDADLGGVIVNEVADLVGGMSRSFVQERSVRIDGSLSFGKIPLRRRPTMSVS